MSHSFDEFSKSLADESVPRRESLRRLGLVIAGSVLGPLSLVPSSATAGPFRVSRKRQPDPCKSFCKCQNSKKQKQCLAACQACNGETNRLAGTCGSYTCVDTSRDPHCGAIGNNCGARGLTCCGGTCVDVASDASNCGACGVVCGNGQTCVGGACQGACIPNCNGSSCGGPDGCGGVCGCPDGYWCEPFSRICAFSEPTPFSPDPNCTADHPYWPNC